MENLELLKQELINQKTVLENKGITVTTAHTNPSPSELTTAISHISPVDMSKATATASDVVKGKTFYDSTGTLCDGNYTDEVKDFLDTLITKLYVPPTLPRFLTSLKQQFLSYCSTDGTVLTIPDTITSLPMQAFYQAKFSKIELPPTLTTLSSYAFSDMPALRYYNIPDSITKMGNYTFNNSTYGTDLYIGTGIQTIPNNTLKKLVSLTNATIPAHITTVEANNFYDIAKLEDFHILGTSTKFNGTIGYKTATNFKIWVPFNSLLYYAEASNIGTHYASLISEVTVTSSSFPTCTSTSSTKHIVWYATLDNAINGTSNITSPSGSGTYYARVVANS